MSFYGRINRADRVSFVTDKIYPNRMTMDRDSATDGIYIGRYVLVEYSQGEGQDIYDINYNIDREVYGASMGRGYDSTVWQKVYADGKEKYVMVAELNSVVPTMSIVVDAPTLSPLPPHFDIESNTASYKLHLQPSWGFKVKEAESKDKSDTEIIYDTVTYVDGAEVFTEVNDVKYDASIFFNKKAFSPETRYNTIANQDNRELADNKIEMTLSSSGYPYNDNHSNPSNLDTYELSIMLPALGEVMSDAWDIIYGSGEQDEDNNNINHRFTKIGWDVDGGPRLVQSSRDINNSGFEYDIEGVKSMAGCINSVHDLMGKIIVNDANNDKPNDTLTDSLVNRIYYRDRKYWMKNNIHGYQDKPEDDLPVVDMREFGDNYYYKTGDNYYLEQEGYQNGNTYYSLENIASITFYGKKWEPNKYYKEYFINNNFMGYQLESSKNPNETIEYFDIKGPTDKTTIVVNNNKSGCCFFPSNYYNLNANSIYQTIFPTVELDINSDENARGKGLFYLHVKDNKTGYLPFNETIKYEDIPKSDGFPILYYWDNYKIEVATQPGSSDLVVTYDFNGAIGTPVKTIPFELNRFYYKDNDKWLLLTDIDNLDNSKTYYPIDQLGVTTISLKEPFYEPNTYYYKDGLDYILGIDQEQRPTVQYYKIGTITQAGKDITFYEPNKYYYKNENGQMVLDTSPTITPNRQYYYDIYTLYVVEDSSGVYPIGSVWNPAVTKPESVKLGYKVDKYEWKELKGFSRTLNTINGLILKINQIIKFDDKITRDTSTVQGCINKLNDIIWKFDQLTPNNLAIVNESGQITSASLYGDTWIDATVNRKNNGMVALTHTGPAVTTHKVINNVTPKFGDSFTITDWTFDTKGHKANSGTHTITIPQGSLRDESEKTESNVLTALGFIPEVGEITTTRTNISKLKLAGYAKEAANDNISSSDTLGAALSKLQTQIIEEKDARSNAINNLDVAENASATKFISKISQTDGKISVERAAAGTLQITDENGNYTIPENASAITKTDSIATAFGKVEAQIKTENTNRINAVETLTNNLNQEIQDRKNAINDLDATLSTGNSYEVITSITQTDGKLTSLNKTAIGNLTLNGWTIGTNTADDIAIADTDTVFNAFAKTQRQINSNRNVIAVLNGDSTIKGSVAYQIAQIVNENNNGKIDNLNEIAAWIINDTTGAAKMGSDIATLYARSDGINKEVKENYVRKEELNNKLTAIDSELDIINLKYDTLSESVEKNNSDITILYARNDGINKEVKENYIRKEDFEVTVQMLLDKITALDNKVIELEKLINQ